jgi:hypothetical protein
VAANELLLPIKISAFHVKFNEIAARSNDFAGIRAVPIGCQEMDGLPQGLSECDYRLGEYSLVRLIGINDESNAIGIIMRSRDWKGPHAFSVFLSIVIITEIAAPERSERERTRIVRGLLRDVNKTKGKGEEIPSASQRVCQDLGGRWNIAGETGRWAISAFEHDAKLDIQVVRPLSGNCPSGVRHN